MFTVSVNCSGCLVGFLALGNQRAFKKGALIFYQGDPSDAFYVIAKGSIKVFVQSSHGDEMVLVTLQAPETLGEVALLDEGPRSASAEALVDSVLLAFARSSVMDLIKNEPTIADGFLRSAGAMLRRLTEQTSDFVFLDLEGRVAKLLVQYAEQRGDASPDGVTLDLGVTQTDLAHMVGGSRQSVNQILHALEARGFVEIGGRTVTIKDDMALRRRASVGG